MKELTLSKLRELGSEAGFDTLGVTSALPLEEAKKRIYSAGLDGNFISASGEWKIENIESYYDPVSVLKDARSVISVGKSYLTSDEIDISSYKEPVGTIPRYTWSNHYSDVKNNLEKLQELISREIKNNFQFRLFSSGPVSAKAAAERAGVGWYGKHSIILNKTFGSWLVLGLMITDLDLEQSIQLKNECLDCKICVESCPSKALNKPYILDKKNCIQYLTNWKGVLPWEMREIWGNRWYGCTTCQDVCPINEKAKIVKRKINKSITPVMPLISLLKMSESEYRGKYKNLQITAKWINWECMQRNAVIALGNIGNPDALPALMYLFDHSNELVKTHIPWALGKIYSNNKKNIKEVLEKKIKLEENIIIRKEIELVLQRM